MSDNEMIYNNEHVSDENLSDNDNTDMDLNNLKLQESSDSDNDNLSEACETVDIRGNELYQVLCSLLEDDDGNNITTLLSQINYTINDQFSKLNNILTQLLSLQIRKYKKNYNNTNNENNSAKQEKNNKKNKKKIKKKQ